MRPTPDLRTKPRRPHPAGVLISLAAAAAAMLLSAPGSQALETLGLQGATPTAVHRQTGNTKAAERVPDGYRRGVASWYYDTGATACGFHAKFGVANRTLPCGTRVSFLHNGRRVTAVVDDRGPYVSGRTWDLDEHTAAALHIGGVATVWAKW